MSSINIYLSEKDKAELQYVCAITGKSASDYVRTMIADLVLKHEKTYDIHLCWELRDVSYGKSKTKAWVSKDGKCIVIRSEHNMRLNIPTPCDSDIVHTINQPNQRTKIKVLGDMIYDTYIDIKHIKATPNGYYELDGIVWEELPDSEFAFYIEGDDE